METNNKQGLQWFFSNSGCKTGKDANDVGVNDYETYNNHTSINETHDNITNDNHTDNGITINLTFVSQQNKPVRIIIIILTAHNLMLYNILSCGVVLPRCNSKPEHGHHGEVVQHNAHHLTHALVVGPLHAHGKPNDQ